jgi:hypothetical protein
LPSVAFVVGHPVQPLSDVRSPAARSAQICRPNGVTRVFQVSRYKVKPLKGSRSRNLLAKELLRPALADEPEPRGPQVSLVCRPELLPRATERLAWAGAGPHGGVAPSRLVERVIPDCDSAEEVTSVIPAKVSCLDIFNWPFVNIPRCDQTGFDEVPHPLADERIKVIVISLHPRLALECRWIASAHARKSAVGMSLFA